MRHSGSCWDLTSEARVRTVVAYVVARPLHVGSFVAMSRRWGRASGLSWRLPTGAARLCVAVHLTCALFGPRLGVAAARWMHSYIVQVAFQLLPQYIILIMLRVQLR